MESDTSEGKEIPYILQTSLGIVKPISDLEKLIKVKPN